MITVLALNPSIDMTISVAEFTYGGLNRALSARKDAGGKGLNAAIAAAAVGARCACIGFMHRENPTLFENKLRENGVDFDFLYCDGATRTNIKVLDESAGVITEINQSGPSVSTEELRAMTELVLRHAAGSDYLVLTGSLPAGCPTGYYRELMEAAADSGCRCVLDADGPRLADGIEAKPFMIKPNRYELELLTGKKLERVEDICRAADELTAKGVGVVAVSLGGGGALITDGREALFAPPIDAQISSTVGAGDSMVAGLTAGFDMGMSLGDAFSMGVAAATAACETEGTSVFAREDYLRLRKRVQLEKLNRE